MLVASSQTGAFIWLSATALPCAVRKAVSASVTRWRMASRDRPGWCRARPSPTICSMVMRGDSEPNGSWNTTCSRERKVLRSRRETSSRLLPRNWISPALRRCRFSTAWASVVLPEPDSPTMPMVSPSRSAKFTPLTAANWSRPNQPAKPRRLRA